MSTVVPGTANTLLPGLGGAGYTSPIKLGLSTPTPAKTTALNNAKSGPQMSFSIPGAGSSFSVPASSTGLYGSTGGVTTPAVKPSGYTTMSQDLGNLSRSLGIAPGYGTSGPLNPGQPAQTPLPTPTNNLSNQPTYSPSGGSIIPQYSSPPAQQSVPQSNPNIGAAVGGNATPPDWYTQALQQQNQPQTQPTPPSPPSPTTSTVPNTPAGYAQSLANNSLAGSSVAGAGALGLLSSTNSPLVQGLLSDYEQKAKAAQQFQQALTQGEQNLTQQAVPLTDVQGEQAAMERNYGIQAQALANQSNIAQQALQSGISEQGAQQTGFNEAGNLGLAGQGLLQSGLTSAGGLVQPSSQYSTLGLGQYQTDSSGQPISGGIQTAINNATLAGVTQGNISQITDYASAASSVSGNVNAFDSFGNQALTFMSQNGINPYSTAVQNTPVLSYLKTIGNPAAVASYTSYMNDLKNTAAALSQAKGITPTASDAQVLATDPSTLNGPQLASWIQAVHNLGTTYHNQLAQNAQGAQAANQGGGTAYTGNISPSSVSNLSSGLSTPTAPANSGASAPPWEQFVLGLGTSLGSALGSVPTAIASGAALKAGETLFASLFL